MNYHQAYAKVRPVIQEYALAKLPQGNYEDIKCPACGGTMRIQRLGFDGRVAKTAAHCSTAFCVNWMD